MTQPLWVVRIHKKLYKLRFFGAKLTKAPLIGKVLEKWLFNDQHNGDKLYYLPQDHIIIDQNIPESENVIIPSEIVKFFINEANYHFLMNECLCRDANNCKDFPHDYGCLFLGEGIKDINPKLGRLVTKEEALAHEAKNQKLGLVHLVGRDKFDAIWMGVKPQTKLMTICNCCPCCCLYRFLPDLSPKLSSKLTRLPGIELFVTDNCIGCEICAEGICFSNAIRIIEGRAVISDECHGCGLCVDVCPQQAIKLVINDATFIDKAINRLSQSVDVK
ncbi:MAG: 4Fe-4S binding protein [Anaerolineaceae bacterium]|nr:4Fe-4S binding protein [Anaerolineaceae bacterium]